MTENLGLENRSHNLRARPVRQSLHRGMSAYESHSISSSWRIKSEIKIVRVDIPETATDICAERRDVGMLVGRSENYIASTARSLGVPLVTDDGDFDRVDGLDVELY